MKVLLAAKGREQSDMWKTFVMSEGIVEKHITVAHAIDECTKLIKENHFDILVIGLELEDAKGATFIQRARSIEQYQFTPTIVAGNITPEDISILFEQGVKHIASKPVTYDGFSEKYKQMIEFEQNLPEIELLARKAKAFLREGNVQMAEKAFEKIEESTFGQEPDVGLALLATDIYIMKGDKKAADNQLMILKGCVEKNPLYDPIYQHRKNKYELMSIKKDMIDHGWTEGDLSADNVESKWTEGDLSSDPSKKPGVETGVADEKKEIGVETGVAGETKEIGTETGVADEKKDIGVESGVKGAEKAIGTEKGVKGSKKEVSAELGEKIEELKKLRKTCKS